MATVGRFAAIHHSRFTCNLAGTITYDHIRRIH